MQAKHLVLYFCCNRETLKDVSKQLPNLFSSVFAQAFIIEAIKFIDFPIFMIAPKECDSAFVFDFEEPHQLLSREEFVGGNVLRFDLGF